MYRRLEHHSSSTMHLVVFLTVVLLGASLGVSQYTERFITTPVDHFGFSTERSFNLRYLVNDTFSRGNPNAPILFYCGNEANIEFFANTIGFVWEFAPKINALIVFAEHRFYGKSVPPHVASENDTNKFGYLTIEQTLADFAQLLNHIKNGTSNSRPVIAIGGSYGGVLAALFRIKYPHLVAGALASSAPLRQFSNMTPCERYSEVITNVFRLSQNGSCATNIKKSWKTLKEIALAEGGVEFFNEVFGFCKPWESPEEVNEMIDTLSRMYWHMAMTNYPYEADVYTPLPANPVKSFCSSLNLDYSDKELIKSLRQALNVYANPKMDKECFQIPKKEVMKPSEMKAWGFQSCSELLTNFCDHAHSMFYTDDTSFEDALDRCKKMYGERVVSGVNRIRNHFGVDDLKHATNIIFSNGLLDPWSAASILTAPNDRTLVINIPDGAHHIDLRYSNSLDPPSVTNARILEQMYLKKWMREFKRRTFIYM